MPLRNLISIPRFDSLLSKLLGIKERSIAPTVATELLPVLSVQDPKAAELDFVRGEQRLFLHDDVAAHGSAASEIHPLICLGNPIGSGKLITLEGFQFYPAPEDSEPPVGYSGIVKLDWVISGPFTGGGFPTWLSIGGGATQWSLNNIGVWADTRWWSPANSGGNLGHALQYYTANGEAAVGSGGGSLGGSGIAAVESFTAAGPVSCSVYKWTEPIVLHPGAALRYLCTFRLPTGGNLIFKFDAWWRERPLEDTEIRPGSS